MLSQLPRARHLTVGPSPCAGPTGPLRSGTANAPISATTPVSYATAMFPLAELLHQRPHHMIPLLQLLPHVPPTVQDVPEPRFILTGDRSHRAVPPTPVSHALLLHHLSGSFVSSKHCLGVGRGVGSHAVSSCS
jgi:hypothetical protein